jgi:hypothetical protein
MPISYTPELIARLKQVTQGLPRPEGVRAVQKLLKVAERTSRTVYARYVSPSVPPHQQPPAVKINERDGKLDTEVKTHRVSKIEDVVALCQVDPAKWETRGFSVSQNRSGEFVWRASFKPGAVGRTFVDDLKADMKGYAPKAAKIKRAAVKGGRLLEIAAFDLHLGKLGWSPEVGADYDIKIARTIYFAAIQEIVEKAQKQGPISRILFPVGNDYLTIDSDSNETTAGTKQDVDSRFNKIYREGRKILVEAIEFLRQVAPVDVIVIPGNHDNVSMFHLGDALECWFHAYDDVKILNAPISRKYYQFGKVMLCFCHGNQEKHANLPGLAAQEQPAMWAATTTREYHTGHVHHLTVKEYMGFNVRTLSSLSGPDRYHHDNGYVGAKRTAQGFLFNEFTGLEAIFESTAVTA